MRGHSMLGVLAAISLGTAGGAIAIADDHAATDGRRRRLPPEPKRQQKAQSEHTQSREIARRKRQAERLAAKKDK